MVTFIIGLIILLIGIIILFIGIHKINEAKQIKVQRTNQIEQINKIIAEKQQQYIQLSDKIKSLEAQERTIYTEQNILRKRINEEINRERTTLNNFYSDLRNQSAKAFASYEENLDTAYKAKEKKYQEQLQTKLVALRDARTAAETELAQVKSALSAAAAAQLRERQKEEKLDFYRIPLTEKDLQDVLTLDKIKAQLYNPVILCKLIWSQYFQKATTTMCARVLKATTPVCGIYKITNIQTQQCYIGQSVDIATRWKQHIKCGLGIEASSTNKLYNAMQKDGVWNFTFELMEQCDRLVLNDREKFWINMYQSDKFGYNSTRGGS